MRLFICSALAFLLCVSCSRSGLPGVEIDSSLRGFVLPKSKVLAGIDLEKIKQSDFFKRHQSELDFPMLNQLPTEIGMDPRRDLSSFLFAWNGADALVMTRGNYAPDQLEKRLSGIARSEQYNRLTLYGDGKRDVVFLPKGVALIGSSAMLKKAVNDDAAGTGGVPEDLQSQLARISKAAQIWEVSTGVIPIQQIPVDSNMASMLENISGYINGTTLGITFAGGVGIDARISCISDEGAKRVHDALRGVIGFARLNTRDGELDQLKIWDAIKVDQQPKEVHITAEYSAELADKVIGMFKGLTSRPR